jgi:amino acid transporter
MSLTEAIEGKPLAPSEAKKEKLSAWTGVPVLGLDALASTGYGPEAALTILASAGLAGVRYFWVIVLFVVVQLASLYFSYRQTAEAYPNGGGAYNVAKDNFGASTALWAGVALLLDYLLNVAVGISAGIGAVVSAVPSVQSYTLPLCLFVLFTLMVVNLRGIRQSGLFFAVPTFGFVGCMVVVMGLGLGRALLGGGHPHAVVAPPPLPHATAAIGTWFLLKAFANGCTAMTGIEAVSNGVPLFREPKVPNAHKTLTAIMLILSVFLLALGYLCPAYHIGAMNEQQPGYQTVLSQLVAAVAGRNVFYYLSLASIFIVLTYSAQTSFADFPRVCRFLSEDRFLPAGFSKRSRRLVYWQGIVVLTILSASLLILFGGITDRLIPLFAVGAFTAFCFSQAGMVRHWMRKRGRRYRTKLALNAIGATITFVVLMIIIVAKFREGAWLTVIVAPAAVLLLRRIHQHYRRITPRG